MLEKSGALIVLAWERLRNNRTRSRRREAFSDEGNLQESQTFATGIYRFSDSGSQQTVALVEGKCNVIFERYKEAKLELMKWLQCFKCLN